MRLSKRLVLFLLAAPAALAQVDRSPLKIKTPPPAFDLIKESDSIGVLIEKTVQTNEPEARHVVTFGIGQMSADHLVLTSNDTITNYDLSHTTPFIAGGLGYYPAKFGGYWGLMASVGYSFREQDNPISGSTLHMISTDLLLSYRYEASTRAWLKPFVGLGPGMNIVFQRGIDELNTSEAKGLLVGELGFGLNIKRLFSMSSPLEWELTTQYKKWIDNRPSDANYNGQLLGVGFSMVL